MVHMFLELTLLAALLAHPALLLAKVCALTVVLDCLTVVIDLFACALASIVEFTLGLTFVIGLVAQMVSGLMASTSRTNCILASPLALLFTLVVGQAFAQRSF